MPQVSQNRRSQLFRNVLYGVSSWLLPIVPTLVATPIVVSKLGKDEYGVLVIFLGFISYFFTTATGKVAAKYVAEFISIREDAAVSPVISATLFVSIGTALVSTAVVAAAAGFIVDEVLRIRDVLRDDAVTGVYLACATVLTTAAAQTFILLLQGLHRFDRYFLLANFTSVSFSIGGLALAWFGFGFLSILAWNLGTWMLAGLLAVVFVRASLPGFRLTLHIPRDIWLLVLRYATGVIGYQLFGNVLLLFERGWVMRHFGAEALTFYAIPMTLAMYIHAFIASLVVSIFPTVNELLAEPAKLRTLYRYSTKLVLAIVVLAIATAAVCGGTFLEVWLRDAAFAHVSTGLLIIHTVTFSILALNTIAWHVAEGFRTASLNAYATLGWMLVGVAAIIVLSPQWGIVGVGAARLIGALPFLPMILYVEQRFLGGVEWSFWLKSCIRLAACAAAAVTVQWALIRTLGINWVSVATAVFLGTALYFGCIIVTRYVSFDELAGVKDFLLNRRRNGQAGADPA